MFNKNIKACSFLLIQISLIAVCQANSLPRDVLTRNNEPMDLQTESSDDSVSVFVKASDSNLNEFDGLPLGVFDPKLFDSFRRQGLLDNTNDAAIFREDFVNQHPTNIEQNKIPSREFEDVENEADNIQDHQNSHFERIDTHDKKNRNNFGQVTNLGQVDFGTQSQIENVRSAGNSFQGFGPNLREFQLFDQENSLPQYEFNGDQTQSSTIKDNKASLSSATSFHIQNQIHLTPKNPGSLSENTEVNAPAELKVTPHHQREINTQHKNNFDTQVIPGILEAKVIPGVLMRQFVDVPTVVNDPLLSIYNSPNYSNQRAPSKRLIIPATDLNAFPVYPHVVNNQAPAKRHLESNNIVRSFPSNNVHVTGGFIPTFFGGNHFLPDIISSATSGRSSRSDNTFTESRGQFVPGILEGGFVPSDFLPLSSFRN